MKKKYLIMLALAALSTAGLHAEEKAEVVAQEGTCVMCLSDEERSFAETLSPRQQKLFSMMTPEQRQAAIETAEEVAASSDSAVEQVMKDEHISILEKDAETVH